MNFTQPVDLLIPVHNAAPAFGALLESLRPRMEKWESLQPKARPRIVIIDDGSSDPAIRGILRRHHVATSCQSTVVVNERSEGFAAAVNRGVRVARPEADVILLNSDTEIHGNALERLQAEVVLDPSLASVTPVTNNGWIASLVDWPRGGDLPLGVGPAELAHRVESASIPGYFAPTGVGFCLYLNRRAIDSIGLFDSDRFGRGYCEEIDWCLRASAWGFRHLISTRAFVYHRGSCSFGEEKRRQLTELNRPKLLALYPGYKPRMTEHLAQDPSQSFRVKLLGA